MHDNGIRAGSPGVLGRVRLGPQPVEGGGGAPNHSRHKTPAKRNVKSHNNG